MFVQRETKQPYIFRKKLHMNRQWILLKPTCIIKNIKMLHWVAEKKKYQKLVKPGKYVIDRPLSYNELINILRGGKQTPIRITFSNVRTLNELAGRIGGLIEADSAEIMDFFSDPGNYSDDGFKPENVISVFIPDTYEFYWNTRRREAL